MRTRALCLLTFMCLAAPAPATVIGLNQIVTPDIQPPGVLSISYQVEHETLGNPLQAQFEYGVTPRFEVAVFDGMRPGVLSASAEYGILTKGPCLLATGFGGWSTRGDRPQAFLEGGYVKGPLRTAAGIVRNRSHTQTIIGVGYQASKALAIQVDYQSGSGNSATAGFNYHITPTLSLNPAMYITNDSPHRALGYAVLTWNVKMR